MPWWMWLLFGLFLLLLEVQTFGGFYLMFFGIGAGLVGLLVGAGAVETPWVEWLLFTVLSLSALAAMRGTLVARLSAGTQSGRVDNLVGEAAVATETIASGAMGRAELRGSSWNVRNAGPTPLAVGQRCRVEQVDGLTLFVRAE